MPTQPNDDRQMPIYSVLLEGEKDAERVHKKERMFNALYALDPQSVDHADKNGETVFHLMASRGFYQI